MNNESVDAKAKDFLLPDNMKVLGFDCKEDKNPYFIYVNDGTKHYNKDYNRTCPEPRGKVYVYVNLEYSKEVGFIGIDQDGDTRHVYNGVCPTEEFLLSLLHNVR